MAPFWYSWLILFPLFCSLLPFFGLGPNRSKLQDMLANLRDVDELPSLQPSVGSPSRPSSSRLPEHEINRADEGKYLRHSGAWKACGYTYLKSVISKDSKRRLYSTDVWATYYSPNIGFLAFSGVWAQLHSFRLAKGRKGLNQL